MVISEMLYEYRLDLGTHRIFFNLTHEAINWERENKFFQENVHIFRGLILNNDWFEDQKPPVTQQLTKLKELPFSSKIISMNAVIVTADTCPCHLALQTEDGQVDEP